MRVHGGFPKEGSPSYGNYYVEIVGIYRAYNPQKCRAKFEFRKWSKGWKLGI